MIYFVKSVMIWQVLMILTTSITYGLPQTPRSYLHGIYWELKPFIFTNENGELDGIIPRVFSEGEYYCMRNKTYTNLLRFDLQLDSRREFSQLLYSNQSYNLLQNFSENTLLWAPYMSFYYKNTRDFLDTQGLRPLEIMKSKQIAVIVPRSMISLTNKLIRGIVYAEQIFVLAFMMTLLFATLIWLVDRKLNCKIEQSFVAGVSTGWWWSLVSMTTVGYGDIVPRSITAKIITIAWLFFGVILACVITATVTGVVIGVGDLDVFGKTVGVLENSIEMKVARENFHTNTMMYGSYSEVLKAVSRGEVFAAMINADVAAWLQEDIHAGEFGAPLSIIKKLPANLYINCLVPRNISNELSAIFECMDILRDEVYSMSIENFLRFCHTNSLFIDSTSNLLLNNAPLQILGGTVFLLVVFGLVFDILCFCSIHANMALRQERHEGDDM